MTYENLGLDSGAVEVYATWCSFCNREESTGEVNIELNKDEFFDLPIGANCLEQAASEGFKIDLK